jgi:hypothetical protein
MAEVSNVALDASCAWSLEIASHMRSSAIHASVVHLAPLLGRLGRRIIFGVALARGALGGLVRLDRRPVP